MSKWKKLENMAELKLSAFKDGQDAGVAFAKLARDLDGNAPLLSRYLKAPMNVTVSDEQVMEVR